MVEIIDNMFNHMNLPDDRIYMTREELSNNVGRLVTKDEYLKYVLWTGAKKI